MQTTPEPTFGDQLKADRFYADLTAVSDFSAVADLDAYVPVPRDWTVLMTDVVGSTKAIQAGRYKDVNMVGAASITAVLNAISGVTIPYVFGGDGASLLVPPSAVEPGRQALLALARLSEKQFGLALRVGSVSVAEVLQRGGAIGVQKLSLSPGNDLALFSGSGLELVDRLVKDPSPDNPFYFLPDEHTPEPNLDGLSCRWEPLKAKGGVSLTLMLRGTSPDQQAQQQVPRSTLGLIQEILHGDPAEAAVPVSDASMRFRWPPRGLWQEAKSTAKGGAILKRFLAIYVESIFQAIAERFNIKIGTYNAPVYRKELQSNTDFRKYDGLLRFVLDVTEQQAGEIERHLADEHAAGRIVYGTHRADSALMTCLVFSLEQSQHIHFVDGADGGFALAAQQFKQRLKGAPQEG